MLDQLQKLTAVNMHLDQKGLDEEGVSADSPVTIDLTQDISLKSAFESDPRAAAFELRNQGRSAEDHQRAVAGRRSDDGHLQRGGFVIPIPNFPPNGRWA